MKKFKFKLILKNQKIQTHTLIHPNRHTQCGMLRKLQGKLQTRKVDSSSMLKNQCHKSSQCPNPRIIVLMPTLRNLRKNDPTKDAGNLKNDSEHFKHTKQVKDCEIHHYMIT